MEELGNNLVENTTLCFAVLQLFHLHSLNAIFGATSLAGARAFITQFKN